MKDSIRPVCAGNGYGGNAVELGKDNTERAVKARNIIILNAGAAIYVAGLASSLDQGVEMAADAIGSGLALAKIDELASFTHVFKKEH